jgi:hypothetical protein
VRGAQLNTCVEPTALAAQPLPVEQMAAGVLDAQAGSVELLN